MIKKQRKNFIKMLYFRNKTKKWAGRSVLTLEKLRLQKRRVDGPLVTVVDVW